MVVLLATYRMFAELTVSGLVERELILCLDDCRGRSHGMFISCENEDCADYMECING